MAENYVQGKPVKAELPAAVRISQAEIIRCSGHDLVTAMTAIGIGFGL